MRILFAEDFDDDPSGVTVIPSAPEPELAAEPMFSLADLDIARQDGWDEGRAAGLAAGLAEAAASRAAQVAEVIGGISAQMATLAQAATAHAEEAAEEIARLLLESLMAMFPVLCARHGEAEVRGMMRVLLPPMIREPAITVRISPHLAQAAVDEISRLDPDLAERVRLVPTDAMAASDVRITWAEGGARRDQQQIWRGIADALANSGLLLHADTKEDALVG